MENLNHLPEKSKRYAVVIGVDEYTNKQITKLSCAANDARALAEVLVKYAGFPNDQVTLIATSEPEERLPTRGNILRRLANLRSVVPNDGLVLISFAGHGIERNDQAFLLPSDAQMSNEIWLLEETSINVRMMCDRIRQINAQQVLMILDACRNEPVAGRGEVANRLTEAFTRGLGFIPDEDRESALDARNSNIKAFATLYATSVGHRAYENTEKRQGYFTWGLLEGLKGGAANAQGEVTLGSLVRYLEEQVPKRVLFDLGQAIEQRPWADIKGYKANELVLAVTPQAIPSKSTFVPITDHMAMELTFWKSIKNSTDIEDFREYLKEYPQGRFAGLARNHIKRLEAAETERQRQREAQARKEAENRQSEEHQHRAREEAEGVKKQEEERRAEEAAEKRRLEIQREAQRLYKESLSLLADEKDEKVTRLTEALRLDPDYFDAYLERSRVYFALGQFENAIRDHSQAIRLNPDYAPAFNSRGRANHRLKQYQDAIKDYDQAIQLKPNYTEAYCRRADAYFELKQNERAVSDYDEVLRLNPNDADVLNSRGRAKHRLGKRLEAIEDYSSAIHINPNHAFAFNNRGADYKALAHNDQALADFTEAIRLDPKYRLAYKNRASVYVRLGRRRDAIADYDRVLELDPKDAGARHSRGLCYGELRQYDQAIADYDAALLLKPDEPDILHHRGNAYVGLKEYQRAIENYDQSLRLKPNNLNALHFRGLAYAESKQFDEAIRDYDAALELKPDHAEILHQRGIAYSVLMQFKRAIENYDQSLTIKPDNAQALHFRGLAYGELKQFDKAIQDYSKALELRPDDSEMLFHRGIAQAELKQYDRAIEDYNRALQLSPNNAKALHFRGLAYAETRRFDSAIKDFDRSLEIEPNDGDVLRHKRSAEARKKWEYGSTMSNPKYDSDLRILESNDYKLEGLLSRETILIVTGCSVYPELLDRPVAEVLRDEIDKRGASNPNRRAVIVGDLWWFAENKEPFLNDCPVLSLGGPIMNQLTVKLIENQLVWGEEEVYQAGGNDLAPRMALWGDDASKTREVVERFILAPDGLESFLSRCWETTSQENEKIEVGAGSNVPGAFIEAVKRSASRSQKVGYPLGTVEKIEGGEIQHFTGSRGFRCCIARSSEDENAWCVRGVIYRKYLTQGGPKGFGFPKSDEERPILSRFGTRGSCSRFEKGLIVFHETGKFGNQKGRLGKAFEVHGGIKTKYNSLGGTNSMLGFPVTDESDEAGGRQSDFEGGSLFWDKKQVHTLIRLLDSSYDDSPFDHGWEQYDGPADPDSLEIVREPPANEPFFSFLGAAERRAVRIPPRGGKPLEFDFPYCALTFRSTDNFHWYVRIKTRTGQEGYVSYWTKQTSPGYLVEGEWNNPLDRKYLDGNWHTIILDLRKEVQAGFRDENLYIDHFCFRGRVDFSNIIVGDSAELIARSVLDPIIL
jgi:tetratricopeptide (TPR) repeat protein